jgi:long-chain acyl-CoA synthetase
VALPADLASKLEHTEAAVLRPLRERLGLADAARLSIGAASIPAGS